MITEWTQASNRLPAFEKNSLKVLVENVKKELTDLTTTKVKMEKSLLPYAPQLSVKVFCAAEDPQWAQFILMLEQKIQDLEKEKAKEQELCEAQKINYQHYPHQLTARIPCMNSICFKDESSTIDILKYEKKQKTKDIIARVEGYLQIGAHSRAEYLISDIKDTHKASFLMGMVRLAQGDTTNAAMIFKTLAKEKEYTDKSELYLKYIASINSYTN